MFLPPFYEYLSSSEYDFDLWYSMIFFINVLEFIRVIVLGPGAEFLRFSTNRGD